MPQYKNSKKERNFLCALKNKYAAFIIFSLSFLPILEKIPWIILCVFGSQKNNYLPNNAERQK